MARSAGTVSLGDKRGKYVRRAVLTKKFELTIDTKDLDRRVNRPVEWTCAFCPCSSLLPMEYGCNKCQPFTKDATLYGRVYK